jgi:TPR repeat protein
MKAERPTDANRTERPPKGEPVQVTVEEAERLLLAQLQDKNKDRKLTLKLLASLYSDTHRYDQALSCLRELMALEPDLEQKAACVGVMGANAEGKGDFGAAVRFYREALAMEPMRNDVWYFIHNNLGYSLNMLGQFAEGEKFCRAAIEINRSRPNGHKNLGIALVGQGHYHEAARCFVAATDYNAGDARSFGLLKDLLQQHPELESDFHRQFARCEEAVKFAVAAIQRARAGKPLKVLVGTNESKWQEMCLHILRAMTGGAVEIHVQTGLAGFVEEACAEDLDLGLLTPMFLLSDQAAAAERDPWVSAVLAVRRIKGSRRMGLILAGIAEEVEKHTQTCREAGADAVLEMSFNAHSLVGVARQVLAQSAEQIDAQAQNDLGDRYATGQGVVKDQAEAVKWYRKAAEQNDAEAQNNLGACYANGQGVAKDEVEAVKWYREAAEQNHALAQFSLGNHYRLGEGVAKDAAEAAKWYRKAAEQDCASAQYNLGCCYASGQGVAKDDVEAVKWCRKAAEQNDSLAQFGLACCYANGQGVVKDQAEAVKWYRKAAEQNHTKAQYNLGFCCANGLGVAKDEAEAVKWYRKAAEQNDAYAQFDLGSCYDHGQGVAKDYVEAVKWYRKAAEQNHADAQFILGCWHLQGKGVTEDYAEGYKWFLLAAGQGDEFKKERVTMLEGLLSREQIAKGQELARRFKPREVLKLNTVEEFIGKQSETEV